MIAITSVEAELVSWCDDPQEVVRVLNRGRFTTFLGQAVGDAEMQSDGVEATLRALRRIGQMIKDGRVVA